MEEIVCKNECCGCHACFSACPKNAITMVEDNRGFKRPVIDQSKCINCGLCKKVCPVLNNKKEIEKKVEAYACYNKNPKERLNSSSGGVFILLAKQIIKRNGVVFGACFDKNFDVIHSYAETEKELSKFMSSKYSQSDIGNAFQKVKDFLEDGRFVLFTGTPCQIEGLKCYLKKDYDKLYTQDIVCHGVPSIKLWRKYLEYQQEKNNEKIKSISFRNKDKGWIGFRSKIVFDKKIYSKSHNDDLFMRAFLCNISLQDSCHNCVFKKKYRNSDITLADYWGIDKVHPNFNDDKGVTLLIIHSDKGKELFNNIKDEVEYIETDYEIASQYNEAITKSAKHCENEEVFFNSIDQMDYEQLISTYVPKTSLIKKTKIFIKGIQKRKFNRHL